MTLLAVIEDKNKRLRAYLPEFMNPFRSCMMRYCSVHDVPNFASTTEYICQHELETGSSASCNYVDTMRDDTNIYLLLKTDILYEEPEMEEGMQEPNVALDDDGHLVIVVSVDMLFGLFGRKNIATDTTWATFLSSYTQNQLLQAVVQMPYPAIAASLCGAGTKGITVGDVANGEVEWQFPNGDVYLDFGLIYKRPWAYTLDSIPGLTAHFGAINMPGIIDEPAYGHALTDIVVEKDLSCAVNLPNCIPVVNGLMYMPSMLNGRMYIKSASEMFNGMYDNAAVMLMDYSEFLSEGSLTTLKLSDCEFINCKFNGKNYVLTIKLPTAYRAKFVNETMFTVIDGRLITFDKVQVKGDGIISIKFNDNELRCMRERDMQLTNNISFNEFMVKPIRTHLQWLEDLFASTSEDIKMAEQEDSINQNRNFFFFIPETDIYINEYMVDDRLNYNGLIVHGNVAGMLQGCKGKEIFEHVICDYMDIRILEHKTGDKPNLVYGSDAHLIGYAPYNHLTTLEKHISDPTRQSDISLDSMPFVDRRAPETVLDNSNKFRLLDVVKLK